MATTKTKPIKSTVEKAIAYICNPEKTDQKLLITTYGCSAETADIEFAYTRDNAEKNGNMKGDVLARHLIQSFAPGEVSFEEAHRIGKELADEVLKGEYEYVLTTHIDKGHVHNHLLFNSVNFVTQRKYRSTKKTYYQIRNISDRLCKEHGLSVVVPGHDKGKSYKEYMETKNGTSWKAKLKDMIDKCIRKADSFEEFLELMKLGGYEIKHGKLMSFRAGGQERFTRGKTVGLNYTEERIRQRIHQKHQKTVMPKTRNTGINLLTDIENNIKAKQNAGYKHWAKLNNLKQAAKTLNFLSENNIFQYQQLLDKIKDVNDLFDETGAKMKEAEKRMTELSLLIKNLANYHQTKPVYDKYRQTKFKDKFKTENESQLIIYEAAHKALIATFPNGAFPNPKALKADYEKLSQQKTDLYGRYTELRKQVRKFETVKANLDRILYQSPQKSKDKKRDVDKEH